MGSESQAQASVRMSYDKDNLYLLVERLDYDLLSQDTVDVYLNPSTQGLGETLRLTVGPNGLQQTARYSGGRWKDRRCRGPRKGLAAGDCGRIVRIRTKDTRWRLSSPARPSRQTPAHCAVH